MEEITTTTMPDATAVAPAPETAPAKAERPKRDPVAHLKTIEEQLESAKSTKDGLVLNGQPVPQELLDTLFILRRKVRRGRKRLQARQAEAASAVIAADGNGTVSPEATTAPATITAEPEDEADDETATDEDDDDDSE